MRNCLKPSYNSCLIILTGIFKFFTCSLLILNCSFNSIYHLIKDLQRFASNIAPIFSLGTIFLETSCKSQFLVSRSIFDSCFKVKNICIIMNRINEFAYTSSIRIPSNLTVCRFQIFLNSILRAHF